MTGAETYLVIVGDTLCLGVILVDASDEQDAAVRALQVEDFPHGDVNVAPFLLPRTLFDAATWAAVEQIPRMTLLPPDVVTAWVLGGQGQGERQ